MCEVSNLICSVVLRLESHILANLKNIVMCRGLMVEWMDSLASCVVEYGFCSKKSLVTCCNWKCGPPNVLN